ncbi:hypothetical protein JMA_41030 (plasmid) [Jeotgalibacillus malaysiensis]|uniref:receptor protein-tyrosine kinase n=1 Tax=Jeotgalibacillus malaysiensis TaxID=1508404 RepID=A0A0B5ATK1_9BACL|nr:glycine rich domain-containing protein [Jeotgalibacillus malaysiensis]AJD93421.1 hypothetical protein JMA_41030 [Jeotgalibacillus malaysiensis]
MKEKKKILQMNKPWKMGLSFAIGLSILSFSPDVAEANGKKWDFNYTGTQQSWVAPSSGKYLVEVWGAQGYTRSTGGGKGGYASSVVNFDANSTLYVNVGGQNGFNGGGAPSNLAGGYGGGGTDLRVEGNTLYHRFIVAGGGGGEFYGLPGVGGGLSGGNVSNRGTQYGGTQTSAGYSTRNGSSGSFGQGGNAYYGGGASGGGGGWYGGAGGSTDYSAYYDADDDSGAGGSGYVLTATSSKPTGYALGAKYFTSDSRLLSGAESMPAPNGGTQTGQSGNGFARITQLVVPPKLTISPSTTQWTTQNISFNVLMEKGEHDLKELVLPDGTKTTDTNRTYTVSNNGTYTFKAIDVMGNETVETVNVSNIDKSAPTATLNAASPSGNRVKLNLTSIADTGGSGIKSILLPNGVLATGSTASYSVSKNGIYEFVITDNAGNQTVKSIEVTTLNDSTIEWSFAYSGAIEEFPIPRSGKYKIETWGAEGGRGTGGYVAGKGAYAVSVLNLNENDWLKVLAGQQGLNNGSSVGSGGGGSFVAKADNTPIAVAGGGGGAYSNSYSGNYYHGQPTRQVAQFSPYTQSQPEGQGGFAGYSGWVYPSTSGAGGGFYGDGMANSYSGGGSAGYAFVNGGGTGKGYASGVHGGFGGGGGTNYVGGGGGGYTGGHAGTGHTGSYHTGGGGGSYFTGAEGFAKGGWEVMPNLAGTGTQTGNSGNGAVKITRIVTPPEFSINVPTLDWTNTGFNATVNVSADGEYEYVKMILPNGTETTSRNFTYPITANGSYKFTAVDANGYRHEKMLVISNIEKNAPTGSESVSTTSWTKNNVTITATGSDTGGSGLKNITLLGDPTGENGNPLVNGNRKTFSISQNGTYTVVYEDNAGNQTQRNVTVSNIDKEGAVASFSPNETVGWAKTNQTVRIDPLDVGASGISYFRYRTSTNNGASWSGWNGNYSSAINVSLYQGLNMIEVELYDRAGNVSTVRSGLYQIDTTIPSGSLSPSTTSWTTGDVTLNVTGVTDSGGSGLSHIELPDGQLVTGTSASYVVSDNGTYTFKLVDNAGNERVLTRTVSNIDKTIPNGTLSLSNSNLTNGTVYIYARGSDSQSGFSRIKNPNGSFTYSTASDFYISENGTYAFEFYDNAGNVRIETIEVTNIDRIAPTYSFSPNGTPVVNGTSYTKDDVTVEMNVSDTGVAGMNYWQYQIYDSNYGYRSWVNKGTAESETVTFNQSGSYFLRLQAYDKAGNNIGTPSSQYFYIDKTKPTASQSYSTTSYTKGNVVLYLNSISDSYSGLDKIVRPDGTVISGTSSTNFTVTENGVYTFTVLDRAGNEQEYTYTVENIDKTLPTFSLSSNGGEWKNVPHTTQILADDNLSGVNTIQYAWSLSSTVQPSSWTSYSAGSTLTQPGEGTYYLWVRVTDKAGNLFVDKSEAFQYEKVAPTGVVTPSTITWTSSDVELTVSGIADIGGSGFKHIVLPDGNITTNPNSVYTVKQNGTYEFKIVDYAGNVTVRTVTVSNIDKTAPTGNFNTVSSNWTNQNVILSVSSVTDAGSGFKHILLPDGSKVLTNNATYEAVENGSYTFKLVDMVGNEKTHTFIIDKIDKTKPVGNVKKTPTDFTIGNVTLTIENVADEQSGFKHVILPDGTKSTSLSANFEVSENGNYTFELVDNAGNINSLDVQVMNIDRQEPVAKLVAVPEAGREVLRLMNITDGFGSGIESIQLPNGTLVGASTSIDYPVTKNGKYVFVIRDKMGNEASYSHHVNNLEHNLVIGEDKASGIKFAEYQMTGAKNQDWTEMDLDAVTSPDGTELIIDKVGVTHVAVHAVDNAGNVELKMRAFLISEETEEISPMKSIRYRLSGATTQEWSIYTTPFEISNEGVTTIEVVAEDVAGNLNNVVRQVKIDKSNPINSAVTITLD